MSSMSFAGIPVSPNAGRIIGRIEHVTPHPHFPPDLLIRVFVESVQDLPGQINFLREESGRVIEVRVRDGQRAGLHPGDRVEVVVHFAGDEHAGGYQAHADHCQILPPDQPDP